MSRRAKFAWGLFLFALMAAYISLWLYSAQWFNREIDRLYANAQAEGVEFLGSKPALTNFPFVPEIHYAQGLKFGNATLLFPALKIRGYPIPGLSLRISFPQGVSLAGIVNPNIWSLDSLKARLGVPYHLPRSFNAGDIARWQEAGGQIDIRDYDLVKGALISNGRGHFSFDEGLQPVFFMDSEVRGYEAFIDAQKDEGLIEPFPAAVGMTILNGLSTADEKTGEREVYLSVSVKNRILTVGPLQVLELPQIVWDTRS